MRRSLSQVKWSLVAAGLLSLASHLTAGPGYLSGKGWTLWDGEHAMSVTIGIVTAVKHDETGISVSADFSPIATIAGPFDPSAHSILPVHITLDAGRGFGTSSVGLAPREGSVVMIVFRIETNDKGVIYGEVTTAVCAFTPDQSALTELTGLDDERIIQTLKRIQEARANADPNPYTQATRPTTQPSTQPAR